MDLAILFFKFDWFLALKVNDKLLNLFEYLKGRVQEWHGKPLVQLLLLKLINYTAYDTPQ